MDYRYVFYTDDINNGILDGYAGDISKKIDLDLEGLREGQEFVVDDVSYKIVSIVPTVNTSPEVKKGMNIHCEKIEAES